MSEPLDRAMMQLRERLGLTVETRIGRIGALAAQRFAVASSDDAPMYFDVAAAQAAGYAALPLPPLLLTSTRQWDPGPRLSDLRPDGTPLTDLGLPEGDVRVLGGGQRIRFFRDVTVDTEVVSRVQLRRVTPEDARGGPLLVVDLLRTFRDAAGTPLVECEETRLLR